MNKLERIKTLLAGKQKHTGQTKASEAPVYKPVTIEKRVVKFNPKFTVKNMKNFDLLEEYQKQGIQILDYLDGNALLADDQGLGKTVQVIAWALLRKIKPMLIICPAILKANWEIELKFWSNINKIQIIDGREQTTIWGDVVIINYDLLTHVVGKENVLRKDIWKVKWKCVVCDEAHYISSGANTIRGWAVEQLVRRSPHFIAITATPGRNRPKDIFQIVHLLDPDLFPNFWSYGHRYCGAKKNYFGPGFTFEGSSNESELNELLHNSIMIRRKKEDLFKGLDKIIRNVVTFPLSNQKDYDKAEAKYTPLDFEGIDKLSSLAVKGKLKACFEWIHNLLLTENKIVIFIENQEVSRELLKEFGDIAVLVDGQTDNKKRDYAVDLFQRCKKCGIRKERHAAEKHAYVYDMRKRIFIGSRAAAAGITLTAAYHVVFLQLWWVSSDIDQAECRVHGRKGDMHGATAWYLVAHNTIEEMRANTLDLKNRMLTKVMDGKDLTREEVLKILIDEHKRNKRRGK